MIFFVTFSVPHPHRWPPVKTKQNSLLFEKSVEDALEVLFRSEPLELHIDCTTVAARCKFIGDRIIFVLLLQKTNFDLPLIVVVRITTSLQSNVSTSKNRNSTEPMQFTKTARRKSTEWLSIQFWYTTVVKQTFVLLCCDDLNLRMLTKRW